MFVNAGARDLLLKGERKKFLEEEWPGIAASIRRLGLSPEELLIEAIIEKSPKTGKEKR